MGRAYQNRKVAMAKTSANKSKVYGKYGRELYVCAKAGSPDPASNLALRSMIERAKKDQVPAHVIEKALEKARGGGGEDFSVARYEGFGPAGTMIIVDCLTDNPNRTFGDVRTAFNKAKCKMGTPGTVSHLFDHAAIFVIKGDEEAVLEALVAGDVDVTDLEADGERVTIFTPHTEYAKAKQALLDAFGESLDFEEDAIQFVPQTTTAIAGEDAEVLEKLLVLLEDLDDVQNVYHNAEF